MARAPAPPRPVARAAGTVVAGLVAVVVAALATATPTPAGAATRPRVALRQIAGVERTTAMAARSGDPAVYVAVQSGQVLALRDGRNPETVLDLGRLVKDGGEQGLLGITFAPDGRHLYVHYSGASAGETVLAEYAWTDGRADPATARVLLTVRQPQANHNGGQILFGPDGMLYLGLGDGGNEGDVGPGHAAGGNGQSRDTLLGKILRIDPRPSTTAPYTIPADNPYATGGGRPEIDVWGLRNPWRFSFDPKGALWIADVGQDQYEEVTRLPEGHIAGANLGWSRYEGTHPYHPGGDSPVVMPQIETAHTDGNCAITGGYVYRGTKIPALRGWYVYSDYCNSVVKAAKITGSHVRTRDLGVESSEISSFGEGTDGELYVLSQDRGVFALEPR